MPSRPQRYGRPSFSPGAWNVSTKLAIALIVGSILAWALKGSVGGLLYLTPAWVVGHLSLWQVVTYAFVDAGPFALLFDALILWQIGGALEATWGARRVVAYSIGMAVAAGVVTVLISLGLPSLAFGQFAGGTVAALALWVAYGWSMGRTQTNFWGIPVSGNWLAGIGVLFVVIEAAFSGWRGAVPEILGVLFTFVAIKWTSPRHLWLRFQSWRLQRQLRGRSRHLRIISKDRNTPTDSDRYLH